MANKDSFFDLTLDDNFGKQLRKFSEITDKKEAAAALDAQILAYKNETRSVSWAKSVIDLREEVMSGYTELLVFSAEKDTLTSLYNEANAYLEQHSAAKINRAKAELDKLEKAKRSMAWCDKVKALHEEVSSWTKAEQSTSGCKARLEELMQEFWGIEMADKFDKVVEALEKDKKKDEDWCDKVDSYASAFKTSYAQYITKGDSYRALQQMAINIRRQPTVEAYKDCIAAADKTVNDTTVRTFHRLNKNLGILDFSLADYIHGFDLAWSGVRGKVEAYEAAKKAEADRSANLRQTFKQYLFRENDDGTIFIGRYKGSDSEVTIPEGVTEIGAGAFAGNDALEELSLPDSLEIIGEGAFSDCTSLAFVTFGAGLTRVEAEAFFACTALTAVSLPRSVVYVGDRAFANCKKMGRFSPLSQKCKTGEDYLENTLYLKRREEEEAREAEEALEEEAREIDDKINSLNKMDRNKTWSRLLKQVRTEVNGLSSSVSVKLRAVGVLEAMEEEAEYLAETNRLEAQIDQLDEDSRTPSWCKKVKALHKTVVDGEYPCSNLKLLKKLHNECLQLEQDLKQAELEEKEKQARLAEEAATAEAKAIDDKIQKAKGMTRGESWRLTLIAIRGEVKRLSAAARKKVTKLDLLEELEKESAALDAANAKRAAAKKKAQKRRDDFMDGLSDFLRTFYLYIIALAIAGAGLIFINTDGLKDWLSPLLTGFGAGMFILVLTLHIDEETDYAFTSLFRTILFFLGMGGMIALCFASRYWTVFSFVMSIGFSISYIVIAARDGYDTEYAGFDVLMAIILPILTVVLFLIWSLVWGFQDYVVRDGVLVDYNIRREAVVEFPEDLGITVIGSDAFRDNDRIKSVIIPDSVTKIEDSAFYDCGALETVTYGDNVVEISATAFQSTHLKTAYITESMTNIDFLNFMKADEIILSEGNDAFHKDGNAIIEIANDRLMKAGADGVIPEGITALAPYAFVNLAEGGSIAISNIATIEANVFSNITAAESITLGEGVKTVKAKAFEGCTTSKLVLSANIESIAEGALDRCWVTDLTVPFIGTRPNSAGDNFGMIFGKDNARSDTYKDDHGNRIPDVLKKVTVLTGDIYKNAFNNAKKIEEIIVLGATEIGYQAFYDCDNLTKLYLPISVTKLGSTMLLSGKHVSFNLYYEGTEADWEKVDKATRSGLDWGWDSGKGTVNVSYNHKRPN